MLIFGIPKSCYGSLKDTDLRKLVLFLFWCKYPNGKKTGSCLNWGRYPGQAMGAELQRFALLRAREDYFPKKYLGLGKILVPEENGLNTIGLAIFSLWSTKRLALPGTQRKRGPAEFLHIFKRPKNTSPRTTISPAWALWDTLCYPHSALVTRRFFIWAVAKRPTKGAMLAGSQRRPD